MDARSAVEILAERNGRLHERIARKFLPGAQSVEDQIQEAYRKFLECPHDFPTLEEAEAFFYTILTNHLIDVIRQRRSTREESAEMDRFGSHHFPQPEAALMARQHREAEKRAISQFSRWIESLPPDFREILHCLFFAEPPLTTVEVARRMHASVSTIQHRASKAIYMLRRASQDMLEVIRQC